MPETELTNKMLRAVLQSNKNGVSMLRLQSEFKSLTGEFIPHKQLGYPTLEAYLRSIPAVVKMEITRAGEVVCFATVCRETVHIAQLVARQRTSKRKSGGSLMVNCQMRVKRATPFMPNAKPKTSLRQPENLHRGMRRQTPLTTGNRGGYGAFGPALGRQQTDTKITPSSQGRTPNVLLHKPPAAGDRKPSDVDRAQGIGPSRSDKRLTLPPRFQRDFQVHLSRNTQQSNVNLNESLSPVSPSTPPPSSYNVQLVQTRLKEILRKFSNGIWVSKLPQLYSKLYNQELPADAMKELEHWTQICTVEKPCTSGLLELLLYPAKTHAQTKAALSQDRTSPVFKKPGSPTHTLPPVTSKPRVPPEIKLKVAELLVKYSSGLWASALPKLFQDVYKLKFPEFILDDLSLLSDVCTADYPMPDNTKKAILYAKVTEDENQNKVTLKVTETALQRLSILTVPPLVIPNEEYPSVLVMESSNTNEVILRYIGEGYSQSQEALEDGMREFYSQHKEKMVLHSLAPGQLVAARAEEEDEFLRANICEVTGDGVKVYYVDHGFFEVISKSKLCELDNQFYTLPFQASKCKLAGLEPFSEEPAVMKVFESLACGKILLAEILERHEVPLVVLYDTSQDDDVNINAACLKALQDRTLENSLKANTVYTNITVTHVCSDGTIYCQLLSKGQARLNEILDKTESYFHSRVTSEFLVSQPFCGKCCVARYKGKWSRVEITNLHGSRVVDILFIDIGVPASVEVVELREIPPPYLQELLSVPPQAIKCCLADLPVSVGSWTPDAVLWLRDAVLNCSDCSMKIVRWDEAKRQVHIYLFTSKNFYDHECSINFQIADSDLWKHQKDVFLSTSSASPRKESSPISQPEAGDCQIDEISQLPPLLALPQPGQNLDIYVSVACHPGYFVLQPWQDLYKLEVLMGEMILYYNKMDGKPIHIEKNQIYAAKVENNWHRVLVKGKLINGLVSVYQLDYGRHELVNCMKVQPLIEEFRQLPFQGVTAQLAGVKQKQWSEEASIVFRNHVEKKPLVAQLDSVHESTHPWERKVVVYLVDTSHEEADIWIHDIMYEFIEELSKAA
ncbi:tudor domain-containing protein 7B-like isoform X1 [Acipenser ruthenus]|uniref:tudor domain-containing protein 7B-like isoform X1 n=1 Tax=Acipenser ruthenus TaxID=7906 RepID=UPI00145B497B|nr:tudor domain-containing protein 7B-like isoform X1 [Acipenser ruthenus]XP_033871458.3 tudor domain-containing protein 7B-like isoform X1 [Acipenser ruthenus]